MRDAAELCRGLLLKARSDCHYFLRGGAVIVKEINKVAGTES